MVDNSARCWADTALLAFNNANETQITSDFRNSAIEWENMNYFFFFSPFGSRFKTIKLQSLQSWDADFPIIPLQTQECT